MKKILALIMAALLILCFVACAEDPAAEDDKKDEDAIVTTKEVDVFENVKKGEAKKVGVALYDLDENGNCEIISYRPSSVEVVDIVLPEETPDGRKIVCIGADAFKAQNSIKSVKIPATYEQIGDYAFYECDGLVSVTIEDKDDKGNSIGVSSIGLGAFLNCAKLESITGTGSVKTVAKYAFKGCTALKSIDLSGAVEVIEEGAFLNCAALTKVSISNNIKSIVKTAFNDCAKLQYEISDNAKYLGNSSNKYVALISAEDLNIESCVINDETKIVAKDAFSNCEYLNNVVVGFNVTNIDSDCFVNTPELVYETYENVNYLRRSGGKSGSENPYAIVMGVTLPIDATGIRFHSDTHMITKDVLSRYVSLIEIDFSNADETDSTKVEKGTADEWKAIIKADGWNNDLLLKVLCKDDTLQLDKHGNVEEDEVKETVSDEEAEEEAEEENAEEE